MSIPNPQTAEAPARSRQAIPQWALDQISEILSRALGMRFFVTGASVSITDHGDVVMPMSNPFVHVIRRDPSYAVDLHFDSTSGREWYNRLNEGDLL